MARARKKKNSASPQPGKDLYSYRGQLGIPTPERAAHMPDGFAIQQLAVGHDHGGGVIQSRQATILSHPGLLAELYTAVVRQHQDENKPLPAHVDVSMTPGDRVTAQNRAILWEYILARIDAVKGNSKIVNYSGASGGAPGSRLPLPEREFTGRNWDRRRFYAWIRRQPGMAYLTAFLDHVVAHDNDTAAEAGHVILKHDMGRALLAKDVTCPNDACQTNFGPRAPASGFCRHCGTRLPQARDRDAEQAFLGGLSFAGHVLAEASRHFVQWEDRHRKRAAA